MTIASIQIEEKGYNREFLNAETTKKKQLKITVEDVFVTCVSVTTYRCLITTHQLVVVVDDGGGLVDRKA